MLNLSDHKLIPENYTGVMDVPEKPLGATVPFKGVFYGIEYFISIPEYQDLLMWCEKNNYNFDGRFISMDDSDLEYWSFRILLNCHIEMEFINRSFKGLIKEIRQFIKECCWQVSPN